MSELKFYERLPCVLSSFALSANTTFILGIIRLPALYFFRLLLLQFHHRFFGKRSLQHGSVTPWPELSRSLPKLNLVPVVS